MSEEDDDYDVDYGSDSEEPYVLAEKMGFVPGETKKREINQEINQEVSEIKKGINNLTERLKIVEDKQNSIKGGKTKKHKRKTRRKTRRKTNKKLRSRKSRGNIRSGK
jgi:hypothetical protein